MTVTSQDTIVASFALQEDYPTLLDNLTFHSIDYSGMDFKSTVPVKNNEPYILTFSTFSDGADLESSIRFCIEEIEDAMYEDLEHEGVVVIAIVIEVQDDDEIERESL